MGLLIWPQKSHISHLYGYISSNIIGKGLLVIIHKSQRVNKSQRNDISLPMEKHSRSYPTAGHGCTPVSVSVLENLRIVYC